MINGRERVFGPGDNPFVENSLSGLAREMELAANAYTIMLRSSAGANLHSKKDIKQECDLPETVNIRLIDYKEMYDRNPIANRVVGVLPDECWQTCPLMYEDEDASVSTDFEKAWKDLGKSFVGEESWFESDQEGNPLWEYLHRADKVSGIGHFGLIVLGIDDGKNLDQPIDGFQDPEPNDKSPSSVYVHNARKQRKLIYISVFGENSLQTGGVEYDNNPHSPRYRKPRIYNIDLGDMDTTDSSTMGREDRTVRVHWSRVIHIADNLDSSDIIGTPRQLPVWNNLLALDKIYNGDGESFWKNSSPRTYFETHPQLGGDVSVDIESLRQAVSKMDNGMQKWMFLMGMAAKTVAPQVVDPKSHVDTQIDAICVKLAIPKRIFLGSERGELASGQDDSTWNDRVRARQRKHCIGRIIVPFVNRLIMIGVLPQPKLYKVEWPDPENLKPIEKATLAVTRIDAMSKYIAGGVQQLIDPLDFFVNELDMDEEDAKGQLERAQKAAEDEAEKAAKEQAEAAKQAATNPPQQPQQSPSEQQTPPGPQTPTSSNQKQAAQQPTQQVPPKKKTTKKAVTPKSSPPTRNEDEYGSWEELSIQDRVVTVNEDTGEIVSVWTENEGNKPLNKPFRTPSGPKKFGVYTKNDKGNIVLVRFGDSDMEIKRDDKERRKSFRARHGCDTNPGPKWKAKYWSCRMWEKGSSVSDVLNEEGDVENVFCPTGKGGGVDPTCSPGETRRALRAVNVEIEGVSEEDERLMKEMFGANFDKSMLANLVGAQPGCKLYIDAQIQRSEEGGIKESSYVEVKVLHKKYTAVRIVRKKTITNEEFFVKEGHRNKGLGIKVFTEQVEAASALGFEKINTHAVRGGDVNGYYTWPRFGFDVDIDNVDFSLAQEIYSQGFATPAGKNVKKISDLMRTKEGREWWKEHGDSVECSFDLAEGSLSRKVLNGYNEEKRRQRAAAGDKFAGRGDSGLGVGQPGRGELVSANEEKKSFKSRPNPLKLDPTRTAARRQVHKANNAYPVPEGVQVLNEDEDEDEDEDVENVFCPTGKGGGVDPTCSPGGSRVLSSGEVLQSVTRKDKSWVLGDGTPAPAHIQNMKPPIPPAWKEVHVNLDPGATVLVQGVDTKGRTQSRYSDSHQAKAAAGKFGRVKELRQKRSEIYKELKQDAKDPKLKENAECLELVMRTGIRPGGGDSKADFQAFGATSLKGSHVRVGSEGDVSLVFVPGKSKGKEKVFPVDDPRLSKILQRRAKKAGPDGDLFSTSAGSLRNYSKSKDGGGFKTKDHRTALGTEVAIAEIKKIGPRTKFTSQSEYKKAVKQVAVKVSEVLGNTPNVALKSYIDPTVFSGWKPPKMRKK